MGFIYSTQLSSRTSVVLIRLSEMEIFLMAFESTNLFNWRNRHEKCSYMCVYFLHKRFPCRTIVLATRQCVKISFSSSVERLTNSSKYFRQVNKRVEIQSIKILRSVNTRKQEVNRVSFFTREKWDSSMFGEKWKRISRVFSQTKALKYAKKSNFYPVVSSIFHK